MTSPPPRMRQRVLRGLAWKAVSQVVFQASRLAVAITLARLLTPHDYGLAGMVIAVGLFALVFSDLALGAAVVQRRHLTEEDRSTVFWASVATGAVFSGLGVALSGPLAAFYGEPDVKPLFMALSISFVLTSLGSIHTALLTREMEFRRLELRQIVATLSGAVVGIGLAVGGAGASAIIGQQLTAVAVGSALVWALSDWRPVWRFSFKSLRALGGFSGKVFGQRVLYYASRSADGILIGRYLGPTALGAYSIAYNIILIPFSQIAGPIQQVMFPAFAEMQEERPRLARTWIRAVSLIGAVTTPALLGMIIVAPDFVPVVLGERWTSAVPVVQCLAFVAMLQSLQTMNADVLQAIDRPGLMLRFIVVWFAANVAAFVIGLHWGIVGVAFAYGVAAAVLEPANAWITARALDTSIVSLGRALAGVAQAAFAMGAVVLCLRLAAVSIGVPASLRLLGLAAVGLAIYVPLCAWRAPEIRAEIAAIAGRRRGAGRPPSVSEPQVP
jgi:O-antigen/teichoic acid export membrane protein